MKPFLLFFGDASSLLDRVVHFIGDFDTVYEAEQAAELLERKDLGNWAQIGLSTASWIMRTGRQDGAEGHYWWEWRNRELVT